MCKQDAETIQKGSAELARLQQVLEASTGSAAAPSQEAQSDANAGRIKAEKKLAKLVKAHETLLALASEAGVDLPDEIAFPTKAAADAAGGIVSGQVQAVPAPGQLFASPALPSVLRVAAVAQSPFPKRHGVPRQGSLAPHVRTRIVLHPDFKAGAVSHLHMYSHIWVLFQFHKNTTSVKEAEPLLPHAIGEAAESPGAPRRNPPKATQFSANQSISVPGLQGKKTGVFSCRSPHHPNNIGMSLVQIDRVATKQVYAPWYNASRKNGLVQCVVLDVSGADFVDGTPIYDIKPYVYLSAEGKRLPVTFGDDAAAVLASHCDHNPASLYSGEPDVLKAALEEILSLDIRAVHQGRLSGSTADSSPPQELLFDGLRLLFTVIESDGGLAVRVGSISKA
ncbi:Trmo [Symbiodinium sp. KB8]|nr:Trmo [Symbiodinium sp. KB8]